MARCRNGPKRTAEKKNLSKNCRPSPRRMSPVRSNNQHGSDAKESISERPTPGSGFGTVDGNLESMQIISPKNIQLLPEAWLCCTLEGSVVSGRDIYEYGVVQGTARRPQESQTHRVPIRNSHRP